MKKREVIILAALLLAILIVSFIYSKFTGKVIGEENLVAYYKFENNVLDEIGNNPGVNYGAIFTTGKIGMAADFDGVNDYVNISDSNSLDITNEITISAWIKADSFINQYPRILAKNYAYDLFINAYTKKLNFVVYNQSGSRKTVFGSTNLSTGIWYHVVGIYNKNAGFRLYVNGIEESLTGDTGFRGDIKISTNPLLIGNFEGLLTPRYFNGTIDELAIWSRALSEEEIETEYEKGILVAYYKFDGNANDKTENNNGGTMGGGVDCSVSGKIGRGCNFDGVNDYISVADNNSLDVNDAVSISAWIKADSFINQYPRILAKNNAYDLFINAYTKKLNFAVYNPATNLRKTVKGSTILSVEEWYHAAATYDKNTGFKLYVNGIEESLTGDTGFRGDIKISTNPLLIGNFEGLTRYFNGTIDELKILNKALTRNQIIDLYLESCKDLESGDNDFYVDINSVCGQCNDNNPGSITAPWCSIQKAANTLVPGQTVYVKEGEYREKILLTNSGTDETNRIIFRAYPNDKPVIKGSDMINTGWVQVNDNRPVWRNNWNHVFTPERSDYFNFRREQFFQNGKALNQARVLYDNTLPFNENSRILELKFENNLNDETGINPGSCTNCPAYVSGKEGMATDFDGINDYVGLSNNIDFSGEYTLSMWIKPKYQEGSIKPIISSYSGSNIELLFRINQNEKFEIFSPISRIFETSPIFEQWQHIDVVKRINIDGGFFIDLYVNGVYKESIKETGLVTNYNSITSIGSHSTAYFNGIIDELRIYSAALSDNEIKKQFYSYSPAQENLLEEGEFYIDAQNRKVYLRLFNNTNPLQQNIEAGIREFSFRNNRYNRINYISIDGFTILHGVNTASAGAIEGWGDYWIIENNNITLTNGVGILYVGNNSVVRNNFLIFNGGVGLASAQGNLNLYEGNVITGNNYKQYLWSGGGGGGGAKFTMLKNSIIRGFYSSYNNGPGIWLDNENYDNIIEKSISHDDLGAGIMVEISGSQSNGTTVRNNIVYNTRYSKGMGAGIFIQNSEGTEVYHNTVYNNSYNGIWLRWHARINSTGGYYTLSNNIINNNIASLNKYSQIKLYNDAISATQPFMHNNQQVIYGNLINNNLYYGSDEQETRWENWRGLTSYDINSNWADPQFVSPNEKNFHLNPSSPAIDNGDASVLVNNDFDNRIRPLGEGYDIGAYEQG